MRENYKNTFQNIHYSRKKPSFILRSVLLTAEFFYKNVIKIKNSLYEKNILKEKKADAYVICVGNLTTGGVGKTPIVAELAVELSKTKKIAVISRGYGAKLSNKTPNIIKDENGIKFEDGTLCGDEPFQLAKKMPENVVVITCADRFKASKIAVEKYGCEVIILDDGFSNRKIKKDKTILVIDSKMRFGNNHLLPMGPLRESLDEIKRADEIILVDKGDSEIASAIEWAKSFNKNVKISKMRPKKIYNSLTKAQVQIQKKESAVAFCAIGQPVQFFDFLDEFYDIKACEAFSDHHKYTKNDIKKLINIAKLNKTNIFITTQKDETKLLEIIKDFQGYSFNVLELETVIEEVYSK